MGTVAGAPERAEGEVRRAALALALSDPRSPLAYETQTDAELISCIVERVPHASPEDCLAAISSVRQLCDAVYEVCNEFRAGRFGAGPAATARAVSHLSHGQPGFSRSEYENIFAAGLLWTAF
jgi:hypothetical protein